MLNPRLNRGECPWITWRWQLILAGQSVASRFYCLEASPEGSSLERFPTLKEKRGQKLYTALTPEINASLLNH
jgi:hypothetical protein